MCFRGRQVSYIGKERVRKDEGRSKESKVKERVGGGKGRAEGKRKGKRREVCRGREGSKVEMREEKKKGKVERKA